MFILKPLSFICLTKDLKLIAIDANLHFCDERKKHRNLNSLLIERPYDFFTSASQTLWSCQNVRDAHGFYLNDVQNSGSKIKSRTRYSPAVFGRILGGPRT